MQFLHRVTASSYRTVRKEALFRVTTKRLKKKDRLQTRGGDEVPKEMWEHRGKAKRGKKKERNHYRTSRTLTKVEKGDNRNAGVLPYEDQSLQR